MRNITCACVVAVLAATPANAEPITFRFTAAVDLGFSGDFPICGCTFSPGDVVSGRVTFDPTVPDEFPEPTNGVYLQPGGALTWASSGANYSGRLGISVTKFSTEDVGFFHESVVFGGGAFSGRDFGSGLLFENDPSGFPLLSSDALPTDPDLLMRFPRRTWVMTEDEMGFVGGTITSVSLDTGAPIPEPATLLLLGIGGLGALATKRRRQ